MIVPTGENAPVLDTSTPYKAQVFHVLQGLDFKSPSVRLELLTSNEFKLIPQLRSQPKRSKVVVTNETVLTLMQQIVDRRKSENASKQQL